MKREHKRVLIHATLTALTLAVVGVAFVQFAGTFLHTPSLRPGAEDLNPVLTEGAEFRVPVMMAFWGFAFVIIGEFIAARFRKSKSPPAEQTSQPVDVEKVLNQLLEKADAERATKPPSDPPVS